MQMTAYSIGADQHERAHAVAGCLQDLGLRDLDALRLRLGFDFAAERRLDWGPVAVERRDEFAIRGDWPVRPCPRSASGVLRNNPAVVLHRLEEGLPLGIDRG